MIIYNDLKEADFTDEVMGKLKGHAIILNNFMPSRDLLNRLIWADIKFYLCIKLYLNNWKDRLKEAWALGIDSVAIDAENYLGSLRYSYAFGQAVNDSLRCGDVILLPEDLGGEKYENYCEFIKGLKPRKVLMERTYNQTEPWNILYFYLRNFWLVLRGIEVWIGIWQESIESDFWRNIQLKTAQTVSGGKVFWYSESKQLPA